MLKKKISNEKTVEELIAAGKEARANGLLSEAIKHYQSALGLGLSSPDEEASVRCLLAEAFDKAGLAGELYDAVSIYDRPDRLRRLSRALQLRVMIQLGLSYSSKNDIPRSVALFNQVLRLAQPDELRIFADCHRGLGRAYRVYSEIQFASDHYSLAVEYYRRIGDSSGLAHSYSNLSFVALKEGEFQEAVGFANAALTMLRDSKDAHALLTAYAYLSLALVYAEDLASVPSVFENCLENARRTGAFVHLMSSANNYALVLCISGDWVRAEQVAKEGYEAALRMSGQSYVANIQDTLAQIYLPQGRFTEANDLLTNALRSATSIQTGQWVEISVQISMGRLCMYQGTPDVAAVHFQRARTICEKLGDNQFLHEAEVGLADALIETGKIEEAKAIVETALSQLRRSPNMETWGYLTRMIAKVEFHQGRGAKAVQYLSQSSSAFEIRGAIYQRAVNRIVLAEMLESSGHLERAIIETETALDVFERLRAIDTEKTKGYLDKLRNRRSKQANDKAIIVTSKSQVSDHNGISIFDDYLLERLLNASVSRKLLLRELLSIAREKAAARGTIVVEIEQGNRLNIVDSIGLEEQEQQELINQIAELKSDEYDQNFVYQFGDGNKSAFLLQIIEPTSPRFMSVDIDLKPLLHLVEHGLHRQFLKSQVRKRPAFDPSVVLAQAEISGFICTGPAMTKVLEQINKIRSSNAAVLITGESGSGKELVARAVHAASARKFGTFLPFNCSSVSRDIVESQLFGYRKGSFTGATANYEGVIRAAEHGTLFLDEIGEMPIDLQPKLLRFLQESEIHPLGESKPIKVDVRLVAATNVDLEKEVAKGKFREDLFYRLNVIRVHVPPLRERREEIPVLIAYYLKQYQQEEGKTDIALSQEAIDLMIVYDWPGNVRQLCNELRRLIAYNESGTTLNVDSLSSEIVGPGQVWFSKPEKSKTETDLSLVDSKQTLAEATDDLERNMIQAALRRSSGNIAQAAKELGLSRGGLYLKMNRLKLQA